MDSRTSPVAEERRCPNCGALVAPDADWCSQCFHPLTSAETGREPGPPVPDAGETPIPPPPIPSPHPAGSGADAAADPRAGATAAVPPPPPGAGPTWTCPGCGEINPLTDDVCPVCGTAFLSLFRDERSRPEVAPRDAIVRSLLFPGLGHALLGRSGEGVARGALFVWTAGIVVLLLLGRGDRPLGPLLGIVVLFALFALVVYVGTAIEAGRIAEGGSPFLSPRGLAWVAAGLVIVTLGLAFVLISGSSGARPDVESPAGDPVVATLPPTVVIPSPSVTVSPPITPTVSPTAPVSATGPVTATPIPGAPAGGAP